jgi:hypothetical protein
MRTMPWEIPGMPQGLSRCYQVNKYQSALGVLLSWRNKTRVKTLRKAWKPNFVSLKAFVMSSNPSTTNNNNNNNNKKTKKNNPAPKNLL